MSSASAAIRSCGSVPRSSASLSASRYIAATCATKVFVAATPISMPARVNRTPSESRVAREPHGGQRVERLARLGDADHEVAGTDDRVAVAVLRRDVHLDRHARPLL